jgi:predicted dehydrogenase
MDGLYSTSQEGDPMKSVVWGVLSTAKIGREKVIPAMQRSALCEFRALASRDLEAARKAGAALGIPKVYGSYEALLEDPEIEAVYNPLPNPLHVPFTLKALAAGKHVLCEKPMALAPEELEELRTAAGPLLVMEAFMVRFHPQWLRVRELIQGGRIGELRAVQVFFSYFNTDPRNLRNQTDQGGGALYDIGCSAIVAGRFFSGADPLRAMALVDRDPTFGTDRMTSGLVDFGAGRHLGFTVSTQCAPYQRVQLCGTKGRLELLIPFNAPKDGATTLLIDDGSALDGQGIASEVLPPCDQYTLQGEAFSRAIRGEFPLPYGIEDALQNARILAALFRSERSGAWETV